LLLVVGRVVGVSRGASQSTILWKGSSRGSGHDLPRWLRNSSPNTWNADLHCLSSRVRGQPLSSPRLRTGRREVAVRIGMILGVLACLSLSGITSRTRQPHGTPGPWPRCTILAAATELLEGAAAGRVPLTWSWLPRLRSSRRCWRFAEACGWPNMTPGAAMLQVLQGWVRLVAREESWALGQGDHLQLSPTWHRLESLEGAAVLLTVAARQSG
jgi:hypothetical protein